KSLHDFYGAFMGVRIARKHLSWYEEKFPERIRLKHQFNQVNDLQQQLDLLESYFALDQENIETTVEASTLTSDRQKKIYLRMHYQINGYRLEWPSFKKC